MRSAALMQEPEERARAALHVEHGVLFVGPLTQIMVQPIQLACTGIPCFVVPGTQVYRQTYSEAAQFTSSTSSAVATCSAQNQGVTLASKIVAWRLFIVAWPSVTAEWPLI